MKTLLLYFLIIPLTLFSQDKKEFMSVFYNVENLFDTIDDPHKNDNQFLPEDEKNWDTEKYFFKLEQISRVFASIYDGKLPEVIALCEVENRNVIEDLLNIKFFDNHKYKIIHKDSPDFRGIDCAILIDTSFFNIVSYNFLEVRVPYANRPTRDIIHVKAGVQGQEINFFVNHWPSRWGGTDKTEYKRIHAAKVLREYIDQINQDENIIIMGDLNDYPDNKSVKDILVKDDFTNLMNSISEFEGSYNYKNNWGFLDHIIVSDNLLESSISNRIRVSEYSVFGPEWMMFIDSKGRKKPNRTFGGNKWYRGFSDHLPVYCIFKF